MKLCTNRQQQQQQQQQQQSSLHYFHSIPIHLFPALPNCTIWYYIGVKQTNFRFQWQWWGVSNKEHNECPYHQQQQKLTSTYLSFIAYIASVIDYLNCCVCLLSPTVLYQHQQCWQPLYQAHCHRDVCLTRYWTLPSDWHKWNTNYSISVASSTTMLDAHNSNTMPDNCNSNTMSDTWSNNTMSKATMSKVIPIQLNPLRRTCTCRQ